MDMNQNQSNSTVVETEKKQNSTMSTIALVFSILGIVCCCCCGGGGSLPAIVGLVLAIISKKNNGADSFNKAALIISIVGIVLNIIAVFTILPMYFIPMISEYMMYY